MAAQMGKGFKGAGRGAVRQNGGRGQAPPPAGGPQLKGPTLLDPTTLCLPFEIKTRSPVQQKVRNPHRKFYADGFRRAVHHWVECPAGTLRQMMAEHMPVTVLPPSKTVQCPSAPEPPEGAVNVRAFICCGVAPDKAVRGPRHVLRRHDVLVSSQITGAGKVMCAYGGRTKEAKDPTLTKHLTRMVNEQCGLDLTGAKWMKLVEFIYADKPRTVFYLPELSAIKTREARVQVKEEEEKYEEEKEVEKEEEYEEDGEKKTRTVKTKEKVEATRTKTVQTVLPFQSALATLREYTLTKASSADTAELCYAADAYDEWLRRDTIERIAEVLTEKRDATRRLEEQREAAEAGKLEAKRKREEKQTEIHQSRLDKEKALRASWDEADEGKTEEEKVAGERERSQELQALKDEERKQIAELMKEEREAALAADQEAAGCTGEPGKKKRRVLERDQAIFELFQLFDRPRGLHTPLTQIPRQVLVSALLCTAEERTMGEAMELSTLGGQYGKTAPVNYANLSNLEKWVDAPDEPEPEAEDASKQGPPMAKGPVKTPGKAPAGGIVKTMPPKPGAKLAKGSPAKASPSKGSPAKGLPTEQPPLEEGDTEMQDEGEGMACLEGDDADDDDMA
eukprot:TRINITY_DN43848_c1_g1_i1.p2 TRINITY_DN43848_c1_g1~~TRINITY_DN43848_c1_g1_i1.p2  ORF type:complete len:649 (+),score=254.46 TRINITY_DN43848_c1_g1_i1:83-1948(+)